MSRKKIKSNFIKSSFQDYLNGQETLSHNHGDPENVPQLYEIKPSYRVARMYLISTRSVAIEKMWKEKKGTGQLVPERCPDQTRAAANKLLLETQRICRKLGIKGIVREGTRLFPWSIGDPRFGAPYFVMDTFEGAVVAMTNELFMYPEGRASKGMFSPEGSQFFGALPYADDQMRQVAANVAESVPQAKGKEKEKREGKVEKKRKGRGEGEDTSEEIGLGERQEMGKESEERDKEEPTKDAKQAVVQGRGQDKSTKKHKIKWKGDGEKKRKGTGGGKGKMKKGGWGKHQEPRIGCGEEAVVGGKGKDQRNDTAKETKPLLSVTKASKNGARVGATRKTCDFCKSKKVKCSNTKPCNLCIRKNETCTYGVKGIPGPKPVFRHIVAPRPNSGEIIAGPASTTTPTALTQGQQTTGQVAAAIPMRASTTGKGKGKRRKDEPDDSDYSSDEFVTLVPQRSAPMAPEEGQPSTSSCDQHTGVKPPRPTPMASMDGQGAGSTIAANQTSEPGEVPEWWVGVPTAELEPHALEGLRKLVEERNSELAKATASPS